MVGDDSRVSSHCARRVAVAIEYRLKASEYPRRWPPPLAARRLSCR